MNSLENWLKELLGLGIGVTAIKTLALLESGVSLKWSKCPCCGSDIKKWARACPKCRATLP